MHEFATVVLLGLAVYAVVNLIRQFGETSRALRIFLDLALGLVVAWVTDYSMFAGWGVSFRSLWMGASGNRLGHRRSGVPVDRDRGAHHVLRATVLRRSHGDRITNPNQGGLRDARRRLAASRRSVRRGRREPGPPPFPSGLSLPRAA
jgi:hypothetical protein